MDFLLPILAKIELICQQPAMTQWGGVQGCTPSSSGVLERMAECSRGVLSGGGRVGPTLVQRRNCRPEVGPNFDQPTAQAGK